SSRRAGTRSFVLNTRWIRTFARDWGIYASGFQPLGVVVVGSWAVGPGWYAVAPLALMTATAWSVAFTAAPSDAVRAERGDAARYAGRGHRAGDGFGAPTR